jgi:hypothetical protein
LYRMQCPKPASSTYERPLGDNPKNPRCIATIHRRSYRFDDTEDTPQTARGLAPTIVGRTQELEQLLSLWGRPWMGTVDGFSSPTSPGRLAPAARTRITSRRVDCAACKSPRDDVPKTVAGGSDPKPRHERGRGAVAAQAPRKPGSLPIRPRRRRPLERVPTCRQNKRRERHNKYSRRRQGRDLAKKQLARLSSAFF